MRLAKSVVGAMLEDTSSLESYLRSMAQRYSGNARAKDLVYGSYEDFVLKNGREWTITANSFKGKRAKAKDCYRNAYQLTLGKGLTYCEGWALHVIPIEHAWCIDDQGNVVDPTWSSGESYFGVAFKTSAVLRAATETGVYGLFGDYKRKHPILRGEFGTREDLSLLNSRSH